jgi:LPS sulfotransferase NodH
MYMIASTPRSGSTFLGDALTDAGSFGAPFEYLHKRNRYRWTARFGSDDMSTLLGQIIAHRTSANGIFGLKAHWNQFAPHADLRLFEPHGGLERVVFIYRRDLAAQAISFLRAVQTWQWESGATPAGRARYQYDGIVHYAKEIRRQNQHWSDYFGSGFDLPLLRIVYEDMVADHEAGLRSVAEFIGGVGATLQVPKRLQRQSGSETAAWRQTFLQDLRDEDRWIAGPQSW